MKTKFYTFAAALFLSATTAFACNDSCRIKIEDEQGFHFWEGLDIGVNGYLHDNAIEVPAGYDFLTLDYARSHSFAWNIGQHNFHIYKNYVNLVTGMGLEWNSYAFKQNISLATNTDMVTPIYESTDFTKNKLRTAWLNVPLMVEFNTSTDEDRDVHFAMGVIGGYNIFRNRMIQEYEVNGDKQKTKTKDDYNVNPFRYELTARVGYGNFSFFGNYGMSEFFKPGHGPKVNPFTLGMTIGF
ncbi:MAG TPA: outer membrane beta-barrel protein [Bacteroidia bacterium]|jgi:hypothetical protein|nr:outer membrane beta-barrel protein [Bacteroidia bacterium]